MLDDLNSRKRMVLVGYGFTSQQGIPSNFHFKEASPRDTRIIS